MYSSRHFVVSGLVFKSLIHFDWQLWSDMTTWVARERERLVLLLFPNGPSASLIRISGGGTQALEIEKKKKKRSELQISD